MSSRSKNVFRNVLTGIVGRFVSIILPFVTRTAILYAMGSIYLGLGTLFSSILSFLGLAELGIGSAIAYAMYKPIARNDIETICNLLGYIKRVYQRIGISILIIGGLIIPFLPMVIKGEVPSDISIYALYILYLINSSIGYFFAGYRQVLLTAFQRMDILNVILLIVNSAVYITQTIIIIITKNYYLYAFIPILGSLLSNVLNLIITNRMFPEIRCNSEIEFKDREEINKRIGGLFGTRLNSLVVHQADIIVISAFIGLEMVTIYGNYYYIMNSICEIIMIFFSSMIASIGNKMATDSVDQNYYLFKKITIINEWIVTICAACFICLYQPFMKLWVGARHMLDLGFVILLVVYFFIYEIQRTVLAFKDAAGIWQEDQLRPYISMTLNLVFNIVLVRKIGIYGIIISTIIAFIISLPWANKVLFNIYFHRSSFENLVVILRSFLITIIACVLSYVFCLVPAEGLCGIAIKLVITVLISNIVFFISNRKRSEIGYLVEYIDDLIKR